MDSIRVRVHSVAMRERFEPTEPPTVLLELYPVAGSLADRTMYELEIGEFRTLLRMLRGVEASLEERGL